MANIQEDFKRELQSGQTKISELNRAKIEEFVAGRLDFLGVKLPSLISLSIRDINLLAAAIDNC